MSDPSARSQAATFLACSFAAVAAFATLPAFAQQQQRPPQRPAQGQQAPAQAQPQGPAPTVVQLKPEPSQTDWVKVCGKEQGATQEVCYTTRDFVSDQGQPVLAVAVYDVKGQPQKITRFILPLGLLLRPGIRFSIDQGQASAGQFAICLPNGCFVEGQINDAFLNAAKRGTTLNVSFQNQVGAEVTFQAPLAGFGKAFDGPPIDPKVLEQQQQQLQQELQKRSEELRQRLQSGGGAAPAPAPAPGAPARP